jgi:hypothetical protein
MSVFRTLYVLGETVAYAHLPMLDYAVLLNALSNHQQRQRFFLQNQVC